MRINLKSLFICYLFSSYLCCAAEPLDTDDKARPYDLSFLRLLDINHDVNKDEFELRYILTQHASNKKTHFFDLINNQIQLFDPDFLILENVEKVSFAFIDKNKS